MINLKELDNLLDITTDDVVSQLNTIDIVEEDELYERIGNGLYLESLEIKSSSELMTFTAIDKSSSKGNGKQYFKELWEKAKEEICKWLKSTDTSKKAIKEFIKILITKLGLSIGNIWIGIIATIILLIIKLGTPRLCEGV